MHELHKSFDSHALTCMLDRPRCHGLIHATNDIRVVIHVNCSHPNRFIFTSHQVLFLLFRILTDQRFKIRERGLAERLHVDHSRQIRCANQPIAQLMQIQLKRTV